MCICNHMNDISMHKSDLGLFIGPLLDRVPRLRYMHQVLVCANYLKLSDGALVYSHRIRLVLRGTEVGPDGKVDLVGPGTCHADRLPAHMHGDRN